jgi:hypothetical protein
MPRPKLPADERRKEVLQVRLTADEKSEIERGAAQLETSAGALMRKSALAVVRGTTTASSRRRKRRG